MSEISLVIRYLDWFVLIASMFLAGLYLKPSELRQALRQYKLIIKALIANAIIIPIIGLGLYLVTPMSPSVATAFLMITFSFGVPLAANFVKGMRGNIPFVTVLIFALALVTSITMPILLDLILPVSFSVRRSFLLIFLFVILFQLAPLLVGSLLGRLQVVQKWLLRPLALLTGVAGIFMIGIVFLVGFAGLKYVGFWPPISIFALIAISLGVGWLMGGPELVNRKVIALNSSLRNFPVCLLLATSVFFDPIDEYAIAVFAMIMLATAFLFSRLAARIREPAKIDPGQAKIDEGKPTSA